MCGRQEVKNHIKDLKDLRMLLIPLSIDIKVLQTLGMARDRPSPYVRGWRYLFP